MHLPTWQKKPCRKLRCRISLTATEYNSRITRDADQKSAQSFCMLFRSVFPFASKNNKIEDEPTMRCRQHANEADTGRRFQSQQKNLFTTTCHRQSAIYYIAARRAASSPPFLIFRESDFDFFSSVDRCRGKWVHAEKLWLQYRFSIAFATANEKANIFVEQTQTSDKQKSNRTTIKKNSAAAADVSNCGERRKKLAPTEAPERGKMRL